MEIKKTITDAIDLLFTTLSEEELYDLTQDPWNTEFSLEDSWLEVMDMDLDEYSLFRNDICNFGIRYFLQKYIKLKITVNR